MGTNYYLRQTACSGCGRYDEFHIGKSSAGWSFSFRGYRPGDDSPGPLGTPVVSREDWVAVLESYPGRVVDEDGEQVADPVGWLRSLPAPDVAQQRREDSRMGPFYRPDGRDWRDPEGFRFYDGEFS
jgi:hypothetical protein